MSAAKPAFKNTHTRRYHLTFSIAFAMMKLRIADKRGRRLTEAERYAIADAAVKELTRHVDLWKLDEEMPYDMSPIAFQRGPPGIDRS